MASGCGCSNSDLHTAVCEDSAGITLPIDASDVLYSSPGPYFPPTVANVKDALDYVNLNPAVVPSMTPQVEGVALGRTNLTDEVTSIGGHSLTTFAGQIPSGNIDTTTVCGSFNLVDLDQNATIAQQNVVIGSSLLPNAGPITNFSGNVMIGHAVFSGDAQDVASCNLIGMPTTTYDGLFVGRIVVRNANVLSTAFNSFDPSNIDGIVLIGSTEARDVQSNTVVIGAGDRAVMTGAPGIVLSQGIQTWDSLSFPHVCGIIGSLPGSPNLDNQCCITHSTLRMENLLTETPTGDAQRLVYYDPSTGRLAPANPLGNYRRVFSTTQTTGASGVVTLNLAALGLGLVPNVFAQVRQASGTVFYACKTISITTALWTGQVFNSVNVVLAAPSMVPSVAGLIVDIAVCY